MAFSQVAYNSETKNYEVYARNGFVTTFFVFPANLKEGDSLPSLYLFAFKKRVTFKFSGTFNEKTDNLQFFLEGPAGYRYKASLQVDVPNGPYSWKLKRHAHTNIGKSNGATMFFVPRTICLAPDTLLTPETDIVNRWSFYGQSVQAKFGRLRLKMQLNKARCGENPEAAGDRKSVGLRRYYEIDEIGEGEKGKENKEPAPLKFTVEASPCAEPCKDAKAQNKEDLDDHYYRPVVKKSQCPPKSSATFLVQDITGSSLQDMPAKAYNALGNWIPDKIQAYLPEPLKTEKFPSVAEIKPKFEAMWTTKSADSADKFDKIEKPPSPELTTRTFSTKSRKTDELNSPTELSKLDKTAHESTAVDSKTNSLKKKQQRTVKTTAIHDGKKTGSLHHKILSNCDSSEVVGSNISMVSKSCAGSSCKCPVTLSSDSEEGDEKKMSTTLSYSKTTDPDSSSKANVKVKKNFNQPLLGFSNIHVSFGKGFTK